MKQLATFALILALTACGAAKGHGLSQPGQPQPAPPQASAPSPQPQGATPPPQPAPSAKPAGDEGPSMPDLDGSFLLGRWGDNGDCSKDVVFDADGSFLSYTGNEGAWTLNGDTLHMEGKTGASDLQLQVIDQNTLRVTNPDGSVGRSQRC